jgi:intraflagellar transport protein 57
MFKINDDYEDEEQILNMDGLNKLNLMNKNTNENKPEEILESTTDASEWKLEVERVLPQLKVMIKNDNKDWRTHVEQMHSLQDSIDSSLKDTKSYLEKLYDEVSKTLEKLNSREKYLNNQLESSMQDFKNYQDRLAEIRETYKSRSSGITERAQMLSQITNELQRIKDEMNETGQSITDGSKIILIFLFKFCF